MALEQGVLTGQEPPAFVELATDLSLFDVQEEVGLVKLGIKPARIGFPFVGPLLDVVEVLLKESKELGSCEDRVGILFVQLHDAGIFGTEDLYQMFELSDVLDHPFDVTFLIYVHGRPDPVNRHSLDLGTQDAG